MKMQRFKALACTLALSLLLSGAGMGVAKADGVGARYCPVGSGLVCWIFGCWCEDSNLSQVASVKCPAYPAMSENSWNNYVETSGACPQQPAPGAAQKPSQ